MTRGERHPVDPMVAEAASLLYLLGGMGAKHLVLIGGLVPPLLVKEPREAHVGTSDLDICLSVAISQGATAEYYESIEELIAPYFEPTVGTSFRWRKRAGAPGLPILVDFLAPRGESAPWADGTHALSDDTAAHNAGPRLRPFVLETQDLLELDAVEREVDIELLYKSTPTRATVRFRHSGPLGLLVAKAFALNGRDDDKDGYDVAWFCLNLDRDPEEAVRQIAERPTFNHPLVPEALSLLKRAFKGPEYPGPTGYANVLARTHGEDPDLHARDCFDAYRATQLVVDGLIKRIDWDKQANSASS